MGTAPPAPVVKAIEAGVARVTRRVAIYEADGITLWNPSFEIDPEFKRLVGGAVTVDYTSDERRKLDVTLMNDDGILRLNPRGGFYYDKIVKVYRGIKYSPYLTNPQVALAEFDGTYADKVTLIRQVATMGYELVDMTGSTDERDFDSYAVVMVVNFAAPTTRVTLLKNVFASGRDIITIGHKNTLTELPWAATVAASGSRTYGLSDSGSDSALAGAVTANTALGTATGTAVTGLSTWAQPVAVYPPNPSSVQTTATIATNTKQAYWLDLHVPISDSVPVLAVLDAALDYMSSKAAMELLWEYQLGEFMIDGINDQIFPDQVKITCRDYTKKLLKDKLQQASTFVAGTNFSSFVRAIAANGGITKFRISAGAEIFPSDVSYDRGTDRWSIIKAACTSFNYEVFFDNEGYLVVRKFLDPTTSATSQTFKTGAQGNLIELGRGVNDNRIYNIVNVYGDTTDTSSARLPYFGTARNDDPNSPTSTQKIGNRVYTFASSYFSSDAQCVTLANSLLKIMALESYELSFTSLLYPWLEVGEIVEILDPNAVATDPTRYLMDTLSLPLDLAPMTGTGKRVTLVGTGSGTPTAGV